MKKEARIACDLRIGDKLDVCGLESVVTKVEMIFHYVPGNIARVELSIPDTKKKVTLFLPRDLKVEILT